MAGKALIILAAAGLLALAAAGGGADLAAAGPRHLLVKWEKNGKAGDQMEWESALAGMSLARRLSPWDAEIAMDLGRIFEWKAIGSPPWAPAAQEARKLAIEQYRQAVALRPSWSVAWINLAQAKALDFSFDQEAAAALLNAMALGRWDRAVSYKVVDLSLAAWDSFPEDQKWRFTAFVKRIVQTKAGRTRVLVAAARMGKEKILASMLENDEDRRALQCLAEARENGSGWEECKP